jgi:antitoxin CptB
VPGAARLNEKGKAEPCSALPFQGFAVQGAIPMDEATLLKKLRWRCRRGMRELDQLFERYLDREWAGAPTEEREVFLFLLESEDDRLWRWFMGYEECPHAEPAALIARIRALPA